MVKLAKLHFFPDFSALYSVLSLGKVKWKDQKFPISCKFGSSAGVVKLFYKFVKNFLLFFFRENKSELSLCFKKYVVYSRNEIIRLLCTLGIQIRNIKMGFMALGVR